MLFLTALLSVDLNSMPFQASTVNFDSSYSVMLIPFDFYAHTLTQLYKKLHVTKDYVSLIWIIMSMYQSCK